MIGQYNIPQILPVQVRVDLCGRDGLMAQHLLNGPKVSATLDQMRSKGVPEGMRTYS